GGNDKEFLEFMKKELDIEEDDKGEKKNDGELLEHDIEEEEGEEKDSNGEFLTFEPDTIANEVLEKPEGIGMEEGDESDQVNVIDIQKSVLQEQILIQNKAPDIEEPQLLTCQALSR